MLDLRFPGQRYDAATGLNENYHRDYDPVAGRYLQSDPIGLAGGMSTYGYVGGDPLGGIDPLGLRKSPGQLLSGIVTRLGGPKLIQQGSALLARQAARKKELLQKQMTAIRARFARWSRAGKAVEAPGCGNVVGNAGAAEGPTLPGMSRPMRAINQHFPPNQAGVDAMNSAAIRNMTDDIRCVDCNEIAESIFRASNGEGRILEARPLSPGNLNVFENGSLEPSQWYHQVYTDGRYVFDPRLSSTPIPMGDWLQHIRGINPDGVILSARPRGFP